VDATLQVYLDGNFFFINLTWPYDGDDWEGAELEARSELLKVAESIDLTDI